MSNIYWYSAKVIKDNGSTLRTGTIRADDPIIAVTYVENLVKVQWKREILTLDICTLDQGEILDTLVSIEYNASGSRTWKQVPERDNEKDRDLPKNQIGEGGIVPNRPLRPNFFPVQVGAPYSPEVFYTYKPR